MKIKMNINQAASEFIKEKREAKGWTQKDLADRVFGIRTKITASGATQICDNRYRISQIELGKKDITLNTLGRILEALDADIDFIER